MMKVFWSKRLPATLLALLMTLSLAPGAMATETTPVPPTPHTHNWSNWVSADETTHSRTCQDVSCNQQEIGQHSFEIVTVPATCTAKGSATYTCSVCHASKVVELPMAEHSWSLTGTVPATCSQNGSSSFKCLVGQAVKTDELPTIAHSYGIGAITTQPTCTAKGVMTYTCTVCGGTKTEDVAMLSHADVNVDGKCDTCGKGMVTSLTVTFKTGSTTITQAVAPGAKPTKPSTPSMSGSNKSYSFVGWTTSSTSSYLYTGQSLTTVESSAVTANTTYYALYTVSATSQNVSTDVSGSSGVNVGSTLRTKINSAFSGITGQSFTSVTFSSASGTSYGTLYANSGETSLSSRNYSYSGGSYPVTDLYFRPSGSRGTYSVAYTATDAYHTVRGTVSISTTSATNKTITYTVRAGEEVTFDRADFNRVFQEEYSGNIRYVAFDTASTLTSSNGVVYYDYAGSGEKAFSKTTIDDYRFYYSSSSYGDYDLNELSFVASADFSSTVKLTFRAYGSGGDYVDGTVEIDSSGSSSSGHVISYTVKPGEEVVFDAEDFNKLYQKEYSGSFRYLTFDGASALTSSNGVVYFDYGGRGEKAFSKTTIDDDRFYYSSSSYGDYDLNELSFVASSDFSSTVKLTFRAYYSSSKYVDGTVEIRSGNAKNDGDVAYTVSPGGSVSFDGEDFNTAYQREYSGDIRYVTFEPSSTLVSSNGVVYANYNGSREKIFSKTTLDDYRFYYSDGNYGDYDLDDLSFVASEDFDTTITISFRAYYSSSKYVDGKLTISPTGSAGGGGGDIRYATNYSTNVQINANDIARFLHKTYPSYALQYVELKGVPENGTLYYNYYGASRYGTSSQWKLTKSNCDSQRLYFSPSSTSQYALSELTYVPSGVNYCVRIPFTAYGASSRSLSGTILISVNVSPVADVYGVVPKNTPVALPAAAIYSSVAASTGTTLSSIQFVSLPSPAAGTLYATSGTGVKADTSTKYGYSSGAYRMSQLRFVPTSSFVGSVDLPYVAYNSSGVAIAGGTFSLGVVNKMNKYSDMPSSSWCYKYVTELSDAKVIGGYKNNTYRPNNTVTYGEALKLILLAADVPAQPPTGSHWASGYLTKAKAAGLLSGNVNLDAPITRLAVAQLAAKAMKLSTSDLSSVKPFTDTSDAYVQALNAAGIVEGYFTNGTSIYKPNATLTRGQISAIVWRMERSEK